MTLHAAKLSTSIPFFTLIVVLLASLAFVSWRTLRVPARRVHFHANFLVLEDGRARDFSGPEFMHIEPCTTNEKTGKGDDHADETLDMHDGDGAIIHVHAPFVTWRDLFAYLKLPTTRADMKFVLNESESAQVLQNTMYIHDKDRLLIVLGTPPADLKQAFTQVASTATEYDAGVRGSELCGGSEDENLSLWERFMIGIGAK